MSGPQPKGVKWDLDKLEPGGTQFVFRASVEQVRSHLYNVKYRQGVLVNVPLVVQPHVEGQQGQPFGERGHRPPGAAHVKRGMEPQVIADIALQRGFPPQKPAATGGKHGPNYGPG